MSTQRLASFKDFQLFAKNASSISSNDEKGTAIGMLLDSVSRRMATYILKSSVYGLNQYASDGVNGPIEKYGIEHYGKHARNEIRLYRPFNIASVTSITDNDTVLTSDEFVLDSKNGIIFRTTGMFYPSPLAVQVVYTAGYAETGAGDTSKLSVPDDLNKACLLQVQYEFSEREPGGVPAGATTISRPDGSLVVQGDGWLKRVADVMKQYRR